MRPKIGVLALQGDFEAHEKALRESGSEPVLVRTRADLDSIDGLILPGGESTTMLKLLDVEDLFEPLRKFGETKPIFGTCAGAILLADNVVNPQQRSLGLLDLTLERNGYGRQIDSRIASIELDGKPAEAVFIRAPIIRRAGPAVRVIASYLGTPVLVENGLHMAATFHPELSSENRIHELFVKKVQNIEKAYLNYTETT
ncbi:MAG: pyridoxal 5'-phosphate synthase glutaminase subunit PdxT [Acidobacteriaceae bacterium]|nr:pyridoxal 5'-phosphate synthase glutaminase subunit PdxT [Acidobacteriaceae bacterium]